MILNIDKYIEENELKFVTTSNIMVSDKFDSNGLFSNEIFGYPGSAKWRNRHAIIALNCSIVHPLVYEVMKRNGSIYLKLFVGDVSIVNGELVDNSTGSFGLSYFRNNLDVCLNALKKSGKLTDKGLKLTEILKREPGSFIDKLLVIPPAYRPAMMKNNKMQVHELNDIYGAIIAETQVIASVGEKSTIYNQMIMKIQEKVYDAYANILTMIKGKAGLQRKSMLGKTLDFSGRAVIVGDNNIPPDSMGVPYVMLLSLFKPFIIHRATKTEYANQLKSHGVQPTMMTINKLIENITEDSSEVSKEVKAIIRSIVADLCKEKVILAKRDPALHRESMRACRPIIVDDSSLHLSVLLTGGYGADFDGDQMAVYFPLTEEAQQQAKDKMLVDKCLYSMEGGLSIGLSNDMIFGVFLMTKYISNNEPIHMNNDVNALVDMMFKMQDTGFRVIIDHQETTVGKAIIYSLTGIMPTGEMRKGDVKKMFSKMAEKMPHGKVATSMHELAKIAFKVPSIYGKTLSVGEFDLPPDLKKRRDAASQADDPSKVYDEITTEFVELKKEQDSIVYDLVTSGARGSNVQIQQTSVAKGYIADQSGKINDKPIENCLNDGLTSAEYFESAAGGRKGIIDRALNTATTGYLSRQYVYAIASVKGDRSIKSCSTKKFLSVDVNDKKIASTLVGRYLSNGKLITSVDEILNKTVDIYSPVYCASPKLCDRCLAKQEFSSNNVENIGIVTAEWIGGAVTQLVMKTFHTGGASSIKIFLEEDKRLSGICRQNGNDIISTRPFTITIPDDDIDDESTDTMILSSRVDFHVDNDIIPLELDYNFTIPFWDDIDIDDSGSIVTINVPENVVFGSMVNATTDVNKAVKAIKKAIDNKLYTPEQTVARLYKLFSLAGSFPMLPIEILVSQLYRDPTQKMFPYRLCRDNKQPYHSSLKEISLLENWKTSAAFENVSKALHYGLLYGKDRKMVSSDLDNLLKY